MLLRRSHAIDRTDWIAGAMHALPPSSPLDGAPTLSRSLTGLVVGSRESAAPGRSASVSDMTSETRTRRALLGSAVAAAAAATVGSFVRPEAASATTGPMQYGVSQSAGGSSTGLASTAGVDSPTLGLYNDGGGMALYAEASIAGGVGVRGQAEAGTGVVGSAGPSASPPSIQGFVGVFGYSQTGFGVAAMSESGVALWVSGKVTFNRSGRAKVAAGKSYVDVDLTAKGGLSGTPLCVATINTRRAGVHVETVRPNYPSSGKLRIYLNKVASSTASTSVSWIVLA